MDLNLNQLRTFHRIAQAGSLVEASRRFNSSASTLSEQLSAIERALGQALFQRTAVGLKLTEAGRRLLAHTELLDAAEGRIQNEFLESEAKTRARLDVGISRMLTHSFSARLMGGIFEGEELRTVAHHGEHGELVRGLQSRELDLVLSESATELDSLVSQELGRSELVVIASSHLAESLGLAELFSKWPMVHYAASTALRWTVDSYLGDTGLSPTVAAEVDDVGLLVEIVASSKAWAVVPAVCPMREIDTGEVRYVDRIPPQYNSRCVAIASDPDQNVVAGVVHRVRERFSALNGRDLTSRSSRVP